MFNKSWRLKENSSYFMYDMAHYCDSLKNELIIPLTGELEEFYQRLCFYASQIKTIKPESFPEGYRLYIFDNRLNLIFHCLDVNGTVFNKCSQFIESTYNSTAYCYGHAEDYYCLSLTSTKWDKNWLKDFQNKLGFIPIEDLALSRFVAYRGETMMESLLISQYQSHLIANRFKSRNLVDWKRIFSEVLP